MFDHVFYISIVTRHDEHDELNTFVRCYYYSMGTRVQRMCFTESVHHDMPVHRYAARTSLAGTATGTAVHNEVVNI